MNDHPFRCAVLTISDRASQGIYEDRSGPALIAFIEQSLKGQIIDSLCIPDEQSQIADQLQCWVNQSPTIDLILTTGGTGLSPRDRTPEAAMQVIDRPHPGLLELARFKTAQITELAYLSRGIAGAAKNSLIITLPGPPKGAIEQVEAIQGVLIHALKTQRGDDNLH